MGTVLGVAWSTMLTAGGAAVTAGASLGAAGLGGLYFAGHVLLGIGIGHLAAILLRVAVRRLIRNTRSRTVEGQVPEAPLATVAVLPLRPAAVPPLRGRHAA
ncbi:hypothetical protein FDW83_02105 [Pseudarthrobacter sp. NamE2]|uniref:hypothetical protein n=1 Tax=Pseudarthrobacter sp. NamE2 TaxID=2576838 RepID=UPI0010FE5CDB|nr:hypothetical protein [Pseudarthrobacter sp. NamE2]TLM86559.1 hypothetical protein FDW83_02105 [Pseudarthrobacter sp. NamE2]